jgi:hypothetical protein
MIISGVYGEIKEEAILDQHRLQPYLGVIYKTGRDLLTSSSFFPKYLAAFSITSL